MVAVIATVMIQKGDAQRTDERDARCAKQAAAPYVPFKSDASCIGWQRKSGSPLSIEG
jgi:hypothetical protein